MLTAVQRDALRFIETYTIEHGGVSPTFDEMAAALGLASKSGVQRVLLCLEDRGYIRRLKNRARAIEVIRPSTHRGAA